MIMGIGFLAGPRSQTDGGFRQWMTLKMPQHKSPCKPRRVGLFSPYKYLKNIHFFFQSDRWQAGGLKTRNIFAICSGSLLHRFCIYFFIYLFIYWWLAMLFSKARSWFWKLSWRTVLLLCDYFLSLVLILSKRDLFPCFAPSYLAEHSLGQLPSTHSMVRIVLISLEHEYSQIQAAQRAQYLFFAWGSNRCSVKNIRTRQVHSDASLKHSPTLRRSKMVALCSKALYFSSQFLNPRQLLCFHRFLWEWAPMVNLQEGFWVCFYYVFAFLFASFILFPPLKMSVESSAGHIISQLKTSSLLISLVLTIPVEGAWDKVLWKQVWNPSSYVTPLGSRARQHTPPLWQSSYLYINHTSLSNTTVSIKGISAPMVSQHR